MQILGPDRYNPEKLKEFEADVSAQASGGSYNPDVNFTVLRIYQFYPTYANAGVVQKILLMVRGRPALAFPASFSSAVALFQPLITLNPTRHRMFYSPTVRGVYIFRRPSDIEIFITPVRRRLKPPAARISHLASRPPHVAPQGLMRAPSTDFSVYLHMLSESVQKEDPLPALAALGKSLSSCHFAEFWAGVDKLGSAVFGQTKGFDDAVRTAIVGMLAVSHSKVPVDVLMASLDLKDAAAVTACVVAAKNPAWRMGADGLEVEGAGEVATITQGKDFEMLPFGRLDPVFTAKPLTSKQ